MKSAMPKRFAFSELSPEAKKAAVEAKKVAQPEPVREDAAVQAELEGSVEKLYVEDGSLA